MVFSVASRSLASGTRQIARTTFVRGFSTAPAPGTQWEGGLPDSIKRMGQSSAFPDEYPGMVYEFNWCLNGDGVTPLKRSAFRINKPLDLKVAGLDAPTKNPLKVTGATIPEAGTDALSFEAFDDICQEVRDNLSLSDNLYCPEGHAPSTTTGVRVISNSWQLAPELVGYLDRCPKTSPPESMAITCFVLDGYEKEFAGFSIEEIEVPVAPEEGVTVAELGYQPKVAKSVATVVVTGTHTLLQKIVGGIEASQKALAQDELERAKKAEEEAKSD
eukprot:Nitzschia sp. Nitz4//scaffold150_size53981//20623//21661//NITZ4_006676-RA/size53981-snap-gene-0.64-mRNA-1//-1//CDS//3329537068//5170//frame0